VTEYENKGAKPRGIPDNAKIEVLIAYNGEPQKDWRGPWLARTTYWGDDRPVTVLKARVIG
jgi:hypothetical protein